MDGLWYVIIFVVLSIVLLPLAIAVWVYFHGDAKHRGEDAFLWACCSFLFAIVVIILRGILNRSAN